MIHQASQQIEQPVEKPRELTPQELAATRLRQLAVRYDFKPNDMNVVLNGATVLMTLFGQLGGERGKNAQLQLQVKNLEFTLQEMNEKFSELARRKDAALQLFAEMTKRQAQIEGVLNGN